MDIGNTLKDARPSYEVDGQHIDAPDWPWHLAGWVLSAIIAALFVLAWVSGGA